MTSLVQKFIEIERAISGKRGSFRLFGLVLREDSQEKWDVIVSSRWLVGDPKSSLKAISKKIESKLKPDELLRVSRVVVLNTNDNIVRAINQAINVEHGSAEVRDCNFSGLQIKHAYIITSTHRDFVSVEAA